MRGKFLAVGLLATLIFSQNGNAKSLEDVLKEKGVITEEDYKEVTKVKPIDYKIGKGFTFTSSDEKFRLSIGGLNQILYTFTDKDKASTTSDSSKWEAHRVQLWTLGHAYTKDLTYFVNLNFAAANSPTLLMDAFLNYRFLDEVQIRAGQSKVPFGRQWLTASGTLQFVERSPVSNAFRPGYDTGADLHGDLFKGLASYDLAVYGGAGWSTLRTTNDNAFAARVTVDPLGKVSAGEADLEGSPKPVLSIGANYFRDTLKKTAGTLEPNKFSFTDSGGWLNTGLGTFAATEKIDLDFVGVDTAFKWKGFSATGEYLFAQADGQTSKNTLRAHGFYAQAGYMVIPEKLELGFRYSYLDPNRDLANDTQTEQLGVVSWYFAKNNLKLQADIGNLHTQKGAAPSQDDLQFRVQTTMVF